MFIPVARAISDDVYGKAHFGGNFLALTDKLGPQSTYNATAETLDLQYLRYPGGALTENYFRLEEPDADRAVHRTTGEERAFVSISDMLTSAETEDRAVDIVLPTRAYLGEDADENGDRYAEVDESALRAFVRGLADGAYGGRPDIASFEIGNEYWGSGLMTAVEYGRIATRMIEIVEEEIAKVPTAGMFDDTKILAQMGMNYGHSSLSGRFDGTPEDQIAAVNATYGLDLAPDAYIYSNAETVAWTKVNNALIIDAFETRGQLGSIDGVVAHIYSKGAAVPNSRYFELSQIDATWRQVLPELEIHVTEWNLKRTVNDVRTDEFGLKQAHEMLNIVEAFEWGGVASARVWPVQMNARTALASEEGVGRLHAPGEMFRIMNDTLVGTRVMSLDGSAGRETEISGESADLHAFFSGSRLVTFVAGKTGEASRQTVDFSQLMEAPGHVSMTRLNVQPGEDPTASTAEPMVTVSYPEDILAEDGLVLDLAPYEIVVIEAHFPTFTPEVIAQAPQDDTPAPVNMLVSVSDTAGRGVDGAILTFDVGEADPPRVLEETGIPGGYGLPLARDMAGRLDGEKLHEPTTDPDIGVSDALDALRLAVGLEPRFGPATPFDLIAADIDRDGEVSVADALDILRFGVGIGVETAPRWVFVDESQDLSGVTADNVTYETGLDVDTTASGPAPEMTGILLGNVDNA